MSTQEPVCKKSGYITRYPPLSFGHVAAFSDVPRLYEAMGEAEQVLKAIEEDREDGEDDGAP